MKVICIGGGAASFFFAAHASSLYPGIQITILEQGTQVLGKVRVSGGGRCNVTHHCFDPEILITHYPRGGSEMLGPFRKFGPQQTIEWFARKGVKIKAEEDGRMFPVSDRSQTIIDCLVRTCERNGVSVLTRAKAKNIRPVEDGSFTIELLNQPPMHADKIFVAPGSSNQMWQVLGHLGMTIVPPVPSLFTFQVRDPRLHGLSGVSVSRITVALADGSLSAEGPLLITHKGLSGPAILKLSARGAREFHALDYNCTIDIDFRPDLTADDIKQWRDLEAKKLLGHHHVLGLPKRLCASLLGHAGLDGQKKFATLSKKEMQALIDLLKTSRFHVSGQNRFKEEFVTAGGVDLEEMNFRDFTSRKYPDMHLAGEVLNIDAVTGGFNFQAAWTGAYLAAQNLVEVR